MLPSHYTRFVDEAGIGKKSKQDRQKYFYRSKKDFDDLIYTATLEEVASSEDLESINIMTNALHGWRNNAKGSSIVAIGDDTHKLISCQHVTKTDDQVSQRHEKLGTERIYQHLRNQNVAVGINTHDLDLSIDEYIRVDHECRSVN